MNGIYCILRSKAYLLLLLISEKNILNTEKYHLLYVILVSRYVSILHIYVDINLVMSAPHTWLDIEVNVTPFQGQSYVGTISSKISNIELKSAIDAIASLLYIFINYFIW